MKERIKFLDKEQQSYIEIADAGELDNHINDDNKHLRAGDREAIEKVHTFDERIKNNTLAIEQEKQERVRLEAAINTETQERIEKDNALEKAILNEKQERIDNDNNLNNRIDTEKQEREAAIEQEAQERRDAVEAEQNARILADASLTGKIVDTNNKLQEHIDNGSVHVTPTQTENWDKAYDHSRDSSIHVTPDEKRQITDNKNNIAAISNALNEHINNADIHITGDEKQQIIKNKKAIQEHISNTDIHITKAEKEDIQANKQRILDAHESIRNEQNERISADAFILNAIKALKGHFYGIYHDTSFYDLNKEDLKDKDWVLRVEGTQTKGMGIFNKASQQWELHNFDIPYGNGGGSIETKDISNEYMTKAPSELFDTDIKVSLTGKIIHASLLLSIKKAHTMSNEELIIGTIENKYVPLFNNSLCFPVYRSVPFDSWIEDFNIVGYCTLNNNEIWFSIIKPEYWHFGDNSWYIINFSYATR